MQYQGALQRSQQQVGLACQALGHSYEVLTYARVADALAPDPVIFSSTPHRVHSGESEIFRTLICQPRTLSVTEEHADVQLIKNAQNLRGSSGRCRSRQSLFVCITLLGLTPWVGCVCIAQNYEMTAVSWLSISCLSYFGFSMVWHQVNQNPDPSPNTWTPGPPVSSTTDLPKPTICLQWPWKTRSLSKKMQSWKKRSNLSTKITWRWRMRQARLWQPLPCSLKWSKR